MKRWPYLTCLSLILVMVFISGCGGGANKVSDVTAGLTVYYPFNNSAVDVMGTTSPDIHNTAYTSDRLGNTNSACDFDGSAAHYITLGTFTISDNSFTVSMWIKSSNSSMYPIYSSIFSFHQKDADTLTFEIPDTGTKISIDGTVTHNQWTHIVGVYDNTTKNGAFYVNGAQTGSGTKTNTLPSLDVNGFQFSVMWAGAIDDFRIYNRVLSASEIDQLYRYYNN